MNNFYLIDKPLWITSFDILRTLKKKLNIKRMWHTWTLDPLASGLVLVAVGDYTKLIPFFEKDFKEYEFKVNLDWVTQSYDLEKEIVFLEKDLQEKYKKELSLEKIKEVLENNFTWKINQVPPKYSALKISWKKAVNMARNWEEFEMKSRIVEIFNIEIISYNYPELFLKAKVGAWTYVRSIAFDLWNILWTWWYVTYLRRTKIWNLDTLLSQKLDDFHESNFLNLELLFWKDKFINLEENILNKVNNWLKQKLDLDINEWIYLIKDQEKVTNIVNYEDKTLIPIRKI